MTIQLTLDETRGLAADDAVAWLRIYVGFEATEGLIRSWSHRGKVRRLGPDGRGRATYSIADLHRHAKTRRDEQRALLCSTP